MSVTEDYILSLPGVQETRSTVLTEDYGLPKSSANLRLTPLDMNMPRIYAARWIICFPLQREVDISKASVKPHHFPRWSYADEFHL